MEHGGCLLVSGDHGDDHQLELPPGFRFHPTDEELITHYLSRKVADGSFVAKAIAEIDFNKIEPWDLPWRAKMGEKEWYFFAVPDRKYPTGLRTNRATDAGYWKATGKDKEIHRGSNLVGMKKTLVFYRGRAPKGEKTNWVMHEYRLHGKLFLYNLPETAKNEWVICRVFQKSCLAASSGGCGGGGKKVAGLVRIGSSSYGDETMMVGGADGSSSLSAPPWMDTEQFGGGTAGKAVRAISGAAHVTCFSNPMEEGQTGYLAGDPLFSAGSADPSPSSLVPSTWPLLLDNYSTLSEPDGAGRLTSSCLRLWSGAGNGMMQLPQSQHGYGVIKKGCAKVEVDVGGCSLSQETGLTTDMNPEISSSVLCKPQVQKLVGLFDGQEVPLTSASSGNVVNAPPDGGIWNY